MVRRWSRLIKHPQPRVKNFTVIFTQTQITNLYLLYNFLVKSYVTSFPLRRRLIRRKYYSNQLFWTSQFNLWSKDYRFTKLIGTYLYTLFLFRRNLASYDFVRCTKLLLCQHQISEVLRISQLPQNLIHKIHHNPKHLPKALQFTCSLYSKPKSTPALISFSLPTLTVTPYISYVNKTSSIQTFTTALSNIKNLVLTQNLEMSRLLYQLMILFVANLTLSSKMNKQWSTRKIYFSPFIWRELFLLNDNPIHLNKKRTLHSRNSQIPTTFSNLLISVHNGKNFHKRHLTRWSVGYTFGELAWTRKPALYKAKQLKKKKK